MRIPTEGERERVRQLRKAVRLLDLARKDLVRLLVRAEQRTRSNDP